MKKYLLVFLLALRQFALADYKPVLVEGREWWCVNPEIHGRLSDPIKLENTITVNGHTYWNLWWFALREDVATQSVYIISKENSATWNDTEEEMLLFKFDCQVGDVFNVYCNVPYGVTQLECTVQNIEIKDGNKHISVRLELTEPSNCNDLENEIDRRECSEEMTRVSNEEWIEGVGNPLRAGVYARYRALHVSEIMPLVCERDGDNIIYENVIQGFSCDNIDDALNEVPADELLTIKDGVLSLKGVANGEASVYTTDGKRVMTFSGSTADISRLPRGLYILRTGTHSAKFVK